LQPLIAYDFFQAVAHLPGKGAVPACRVADNRCRSVLVVLSLLTLAMCPLGWARAGVWFNEIHYHPASEDLREEFIELYNSGSNEVSLAGWRLTRGVEFAFPDVTLAAGDYMVVAADVDRFRELHPDVTNVVGNWSGRLSNSRDTLELVDAAGRVVNRVTYADEGDWAVRMRSAPDRGQRGWIWTTPADGGGSSLELVQPGLPNIHGQNWLPSRVPGGTPGRPNSVAASNLPPMIVEVRHHPVVPRSTDPVWIMARVVDENPDRAALVLHWRVDGAPEFQALPMQDDGTHQDGAPGDGWFGAMVPPQPHDAIVEFYLEALDETGQTRFWPAPAVETNGAALGPVANALYQVDDTGYTGPFPLYKLVLTEAERQQLAAIGSATDGTQYSDAQMNATFITHDAAGWEVRYLVGVRNRGHGSRNRQPNNYRVNLRSDEPWHGVTALNLNGQYSHLQILGATLALKAGLAGAFSRPVQLRINNRNPGNNGPQTYGGCYAANEVINSEWAERWFPDDPAGNVYRALRDIAPSVFAWRGTNYRSYTNTWFKWTNTSENDWSDLLQMLRVLGTNDLFSLEAVRSVIHLDHWMTYFAVMALFDNRETSLYNGYNDDYVMYAGAVDRRFRLMYYDLDSILGQGGHSGSTTGDFLQWTRDADLPALQQLWSLPETRELFYQTLDRLMRTTFSETEFALTVDQTLRDFVPESARTALKQWMTARRNFLATEIAPHLQTHPTTPRARVRGEPRSPTPLTTAVLTVSGDRVVTYRYRLNDGPWSDPRPVTEPILLTNLVHGSTQQVAVLGADAEGLWQPESAPTFSTTWIVDTNWPGVRINEVLARNVAAVPHEGTWPDLIELYNETDTPVDLSGMRLSDDPAQPARFTFPAGTVLPPYGFLVLWANNPDGTSGLHTGFGLNQDGEGVYLFDAPARGGRLLDSVTFGLQLPDLSIGRIGTAGRFDLTRPTPGQDNEPQPLGDPRALRINEWLARAEQTFSTDFVELYNPGSLPVALGGLYLTDNPIGQPQRHRIADLSFIGPGGFRLFRADGDPEQGADHLSFKLAPDQGLIALLDPDRQLLDIVVYGPQQTDVAQGRVPDGADVIRNLTLPTAGASNGTAPPPCTTEVQSIVLVDWTQTWRYQQTTNLDGQPWFAPDYDDAAWPSGPGLLAFESNSSLTGLIQTSLDDPRRPPGDTGLQPGHAYYFRTTFVVPAQPTNLACVAELRVDDGSVVYLNGQEVLRVRMPAGPVSHNTLATDTPPGGDATGVESFTLPGAWFLNGTNVLAVSVHQQSTNSSDIVWGLRLTATRTFTNCSRGGVVLNEIVGRAATEAEGPAADWIEVLNPGPEPVDLTGMALSDDLLQPQRWVFPTGTFLPPGERLVVVCNPDLPPSATNTGFGLAAAGGAVYLFDRPDNGGAALDALFYGAQAAGFSLARIPDGTGDWTLGLPTAGTPNVPAALGSPTLLRINEWMADPAEGDDWIELYNPSGQPVELSGLSLSDDPADRLKSPFPDRSYIGPGDYWVVQADGRATGTADHARFRLDAQGGWIGLYLPTGQQLDGVSYGPQNRGVSEGRLPDGADTVAAFPSTPSPGAPNYIPLPSIVINEVLTHTDPPLEDAIELYNPSATIVDISGWFLSDDSLRPWKYRIPSGTFVPPGGFAVFYEYQFGNPQDPHAWEPFRLNSAHGGEVVLSEVNQAGQWTGRRARVRFGAAANGVSFGRHLTSWTEEFVPMAARSFGVDDPPDLEAFRTGTGAPNPGPLVGPIILSEIHPAPAERFDPDRPDSGQFVELFNTSDQPVPLYDPNAPTNRWRLTGDVAFTFPPDFVLAGGRAVVLVGFDPVNQPEELAWFRATYQMDETVPVLGPWSGRLGLPGGPLALYKPDPPQLPPQPDAGFVPYVLVEQLHYTGAAPWPPLTGPAGLSLHRARIRGFANEPLHWITDIPTPGTPATADADADGLPDWWERRRGLDPASAAGDQGGEGDPDGDGQSNRAEYVAGTDPLDAADRPQIARVQPAPGGWVLEFPAVAGRSYTVLCSDLAPTGPWYVWKQLPTVLQTGTVVILDDRPRSVQRFYRLQVTLEP